MNHLPKNQKRYYSFLFSDQSLKVGKINPAGNQMEGIFEFPYPSDILQNGEIVNEEAFLQFLNEVKNTLKIDGEYIVIGISETRSYTHTIVFPNIDPKDIDQAIEYKSDTFLPFPYENLYLDWKIIENLPDGSKKILISAIPKHILDPYIQAFEKNNLFPKSIVSSSLLLWNLIPPPDKKLCFALEKDKHHFLLLLSNQNNFEATSVVYSEEELFSSIDKMNDFYLLQKGVKKFPEKIYLCGTDLDDSFLEKLRDKKLEPQILKPQVMGIPSEKTPVFATLVSLCQKNISDPQDCYSLDILPENLAIKYQRIKNEKTIKKINLILLVILFIFTIFINLLNFNLYQQIKQYEKQFPQDISLSYNFQKISQNLPKIKTLNQLIQKQEKAIQILNLFNNQNGIKLYLLSYAEENKTGYLTGFAPNRNTLISFTQKLEKQKIFKKVILPLSSLEKEENIEFKLIFQI